MKKRNTGINLFKLFSMFMIALLHVLGMGGITGAAAGTSSYYPVYLMQNAAFCAVNCYALISGYLMLGKKIKPSRITELWFEIFFYSVGLSAIMISIYREFFSAQNIVYALTPIISKQYWYMTAYFLMYLFIPMMNKFAEAADKKSFTAVIAVILLLTTGSFIIGKDGFKFSEGYSPIWLMVMYLVGAYMKKFGVGTKMKWYSALLFYIISVGCNFALNIFLKDPMKKDIYRRHRKLSDIYFAFCGLVRNLPFHILLEAEIRKENGEVYKLYNPSRSRSLSDTYSSARVQ